MAYWQNGKLYMHCSTQSTVRTVGAVARWVGDRSGERGDHQRVHGRRVRQQGIVVGVHGGARTAGEEDERAGDDAHHPRRRAVHRPRATRVARAAQGRVQEGRPHHRHRRPRDSRQRSLRRRRRRALGGRSHLAVVPATGDALAHVVGADQYAAARRPAGAGRDAGQRHHGADRRQGRQAAGGRPGRHPPHQRAGRKGAVRRHRPARTAELHDQRVPEAGARPGRRAVQAGTSARRAAAGARDRRSAASASGSAPTRPGRWASTVCS